MPFAKTASTKDIKPGQMKNIQIQRKEILLANIAGQYYAIGNRCTHFGCLLSNGTLEGTTVTCPCHGSSFNVTTGTPTHGPASEPEPTYQVKVEDDQIQIDIQP